MNDPSKPFVPTFRTPGQIAFEAYNAGGKNPGKSWDGKPVPAWTDLNDDVRAKWQAGARGLFEAIGECVLAVSEIEANPVDKQDARDLVDLFTELSISGIPSPAEVCAQYAKGGGFKQCAEKDSGGAQCVRRAGHELPGHSCEPQDEGR